MRKIYKRKSKGWVKHLDFILLDLLVMLIALILSCFLRFGIGNPFQTMEYKILLIMVILNDYVSILILDSYKSVLKRGYFREMVATVQRACLIFLLTFAYLFFTQMSDIYSRFIFITMFLLYIVLSYLVTILWKRYLVNYRRKHNVRSNAILIIASKSNAKDTILTMRKWNVEGNVIVGIATPQEVRDINNVEGVPIVACYDTLIDYVTTHWVDEVFISTMTEDILDDDTINELIMMGVTVHFNLNRYAEAADAKQVVNVVGGMKVITTSMNYMTPRQNAEKRAMDIAGGLVGCFLTGIIYIFVAPLIKRESPGPVFYTQTRIGKNGKPFKFYKFRSMYLDADERKAELMEQNRMTDGLMFKVEFDPRIIGNRIDENGNQKTGIGEFIRRYSLDEFPQFYNVLRGDMSLVGTRPPLVDEYKNYESHHKARLATKPGITGLWQVSGRNDIMDFEEVVKLDTEYINNWSVGMDLRILLKTVLVVFRKDGAM